MKFVALPLLCSSLVSCETFRAMHDPAECKRPRENLWVKAQLEGTEKFMNLDFKELSRNEMVNWKTHLEGSAGSSYTLKPAMARVMELEKCFNPEAKSIAAAHSAKVAEFYTAYELKVKEAEARIAESNALHRQKLAKEEEAKIANERAFESDCKESASILTKKVLKYSCDVGLNQIIEGLQSGRNKPDDFKHQVVYFDVHGPSSLKPSKQHRTKAYSQVLIIR